MVVLENINAEISVIRSKRKSLSIEVRAGKVIVRAPLKMRDKEISKYLEIKKGWIEKCLNKFALRQQQTENLPPFTEDEIKVMKKRAKEIINSRAEYYAEKLNVEYNRISIRCQHRRWGSCSSQKNLNFNCLLVLFPLEALDSVVVHELCHLKHMNHSADFYKEIDKVFPDYKKWHKYLNENGSAYFDRLP